MKADFSRFTFDPRRHYRGVLTQQGRVQLDADWNEQQAIAAYRAETTARDIIGTCGGPLDGAGFAVVNDPAKLRQVDRDVLTKLGLLSLQPGDFFLSAGHYYVDGILCENEYARPFSAQPDAPDATPISKIKPGVYLLYLHVWERLLTALDDPRMRETALGGPDTATRSKIVRQARLLQVSTDPTAKLDCASSFSDYDDITKPSDGTLTAQTLQTAPPVDPCDVSPAAGYRGLENQLYRVEVHKGGKTGNATFKWSRDNGSVVTSVTRIDSANNQVWVQSVGPDKVLDFEAEQWVELSDDHNDLSGDPNGRHGELLQIKDVTAPGVITLKTAPTKLANNANGVDPSLHPKLRRWDQSGTGATSSGVKATAGLIDLENGIQIKFSAAANYKTGDYWLIPARAVNLDSQSGGVIEWPGDAGVPLALPPQGIAHHYCRLALIRWDGTTIKATDCRCLFPLLTEMTDLFYVSGDGQEAMPNLLKPNDPVKLPPPLVVGVSNAHCRAGAAKVRFSVILGDGQVMEHGKPPVGNGKVADILTDGAGLASCDWQLDPKTRRQQVEARLLDANDQPLFLPVIFNANLSVADQVAYDPKQCAGLGNQVTVQSAIDRLAAQVSLYPLDGGGQELTPGEPAKHLKVIAASRCGPVPGVKVLFTVTDGTSKVNGASPSAQVPTDSQGIAECTWALDDNTDFQQVVATFDPSETRAKAAPDTVVFTANLSRAVHVSYKPATECKSLAGVTNVQDALDKLCSLERGGGCSVTVGEGGQYRRLDEAFRELDAKLVGDICICLLPGEHVLEDGLNITRLPSGLDRYVRIEGCGRGSRVIIRNKPLRVAGPASFTLQSVSIEPEVDKPILIGECREVNIFDSYMRTISPIEPQLLTIDRAGDVTTVRLHNNYLVSQTPGDSFEFGGATIRTTDSQPASNFPAPRQLFAQLNDLARQMSGKSAAAVKARAAFSGQIDKYLHDHPQMAEWQRQSYESASKTLRAGQEAPGRPVVASGPNLEEITAALILVLFPATAIVIMDGVSDVEMLNNQIIGGVRLYESRDPSKAGPLPSNRRNEIFRKIGQENFPLRKSTGSLLFSGNHFTGLGIGNGVEAHIVDNEKMIGLYRRCSLTDNTIAFGNNVLLGDQLTFTGNGFNDGLDSAQLACSVAGRGIILVGNSAPVVTSTIKYAVTPPPSAMQPSANLIVVVPF